MLLNPTKRTSRDPDDVMTLQVADDPSETHRNGSHVTQTEGQQKLEEAPIAQLESPEFDFQDAHLPLEVCYLWHSSYCHCFRR